MTDDARPRRTRVLPGADARRRRRDGLRARAQRHAQPARGRPVRRAERRALRRPRLPGAGARGRARWRRWPSTAWPRPGSPGCRWPTAAPRSARWPAPGGAQFTLPLIAVTGSNGKTTVTQMIAAILRAWHGDAALATAGQLQQPHRRAADAAAACATRRIARRWSRLGMNHPGEIALLAALAAADGRARQQRAARAPGVHGQRGERRARERRRDRRPAAPTAWRCSRPTTRTRRSGTRSPARAAR